MAASNVALDTKAKLVGMSACDKIQHFGANPEHMSGSKTNEGRGLNSKGVFVVMAQQPGCAPGLQLLCLRRLACSGAKLCACKLSLSAWLHSNELKVHFLGA
jgi:hypothetical protein